MGEEVSRPDVPRRQEPCVGQGHHVEEDAPLGQLGGDSGRAAAARIGTDLLRHMDHDPERATVPRQCHACLTQAAAQPEPAGRILLIISNELVKPAMDAKLPDCLAQAYTGQP